jgi:hypothetical protein
MENCSSPQGNKNKIAQLTKIEYDPIIKCEPECGPREQSHIAGISVNLYILETIWVLSG